MNLSKINTLPHHISHTELKNIIQWIMVIFAYAWWAVIIVFYGLLEQDEGHINPEY